MHKTGVFIPQPRLPNPRKQRVRIVEPQPRKMVPATHQPRPPLVVNASESEGEELISEADRDARLAYVLSIHVQGKECSNTVIRRTRTSTPIHVRDEERPMSSGDESDDADLTDGGSTNSEWTDLEGMSIFRKYGIQVKIMIRSYPESG